MEAQAYIKYIHISPKKLRFMLDDVKKRSPRQALDHLFHSQKRNSKVLYKALQSAMSNARAVLKIDDNAMQFKTFLVEEGPSLRRMRPGPKGMANMYKRRTSHIKVVLTAASSATVSPVAIEAKKMVAASTKTSAPKAKLAAGPKKQTKPKTAELKVEASPKKSTRVDTK